MRRSEYSEKTISLVAWSLRRALIQRTVQIPHPEFADMYADGGEGGIRTPDRLAPMPRFECGAFDHSATSPGAMTGRIRPSVGACSRRGRRGRQGAGQRNSCRAPGSKKGGKKWSI